MIGLVQDSGYSSGQPLFRAKIGTHWTPSQFVAEALKVDHPYDKEVTLPPSVAQTFVEIAQLGPKALRDLRDGTLAHYENRRKDLEAEERALHAKLDPGVEATVKDKNILLFKEMLIDCGYDDIAVADLLIFGVRVVGLLERIGIWRPDPDKGPSIPKEAVWANAKAAQARASKQPGTGAHAQELWDKTIEELNAGALQGPFSSEQVSNLLGPLWAPARRFPVVQNGAVRPVDDFSEPLINSAFGSSEKVQIHNIDQVVAWARIWYDCLKERDGRLCISITDTSGKVWFTYLHEDWTADTWLAVLGRVADLKSAYKQMPRHPADSSFSVIAVQEPSSSQTKFFVALAMMFGQTSAVYAFLRFSRALATIASRLFKLIVVEYFDDFSQLEPTFTSNSALRAMEGLLRLLGWRISTGEAKRKPFEKVFVSLGVTVDLSNLRTGKVVVSMKPGRLESIADLVAKVVREQSIDFKQALSIRGKVVFAQGQLFGKIAAPACRILSELAKRGGRLRLPAFASQALSDMLRSLASSPPKVLLRKVPRRPVLIFTDGACEDVTSIGAVLVDPEGHYEHFGAVISQSVVDSWKTRQLQAQVIGQAELFPILVAKHTWRDRIRGRSVIFFIDNEGARLGFVKSYSPVEPSLDIISASIQFDVEHEVLSWFARVPSKANIGDDPSRLVHPECDLFTLSCVLPVFPPGSSPASILMVD